MRLIPSQDDEEEVRRLLVTAGPRPAIPREDLEAISVAARSAWHTHVRRRSPVWSLRSAFALAASLAAVIIGLAVWRNWRNEELAQAPGARVEAIAGSVYLKMEGAEARRIVKGDSIPLGGILSSPRVTTSGRTSLRLPDGTIVRLDVGTEMRLIAAGILELEHGALYLDTGLQTGRRLEVRTSAGTARDIGTQFVVRLPEPGVRTLQVLVRQGSVVVERGGRSYVTPAGRALMIRADGTSEMQDVAAHGTEWTWIMAAAGAYQVEGRNLQELLDWVARETGWKIRYASEELAASAIGIVLHGNIGELRADQAPFVVLPSAGLEAELEEGVLVIRRAR